MLADASVPVWLTEEEMDVVTAGTALDPLQSVAISVLASLQSVVVTNTSTQTVETILPGGTAVTSTVSCNSSCTASITSVNLANSTSSTVIVPLP